MNENVVQLGTLNIWRYGIILYTINIVYKNKVPLTNCKYYYESEWGIKINENIK